MLGTFDAISSNAVIEHLDDTINGWKYLNRLLKSMENGGGDYVTCFSFPDNRGLFALGNKNKITRMFVQQEIIRDFV